jgi:hypothetical protein
VGTFLPQSEGLKRPVGIIGRDAALMLHIKIPSRLLPLMAVHHKWLARKPDAADALRFAQYLHCEHQAAVFGFRRRPKFTLLVDLARPQDAILSSFSQTTRYEISRCARENVRLEVETDIQRFCSFLNASADTKGRGHVDLAKLAPYWPHMHVSKAVADDGTLVMHAHLLDPQSRRAVLYQSASLFRLEPGPQHRNRVGRANRWLHFRDMLAFKERGAAVYDFGGYAKDTSNSELRGINEFKDGFGGVLVEQSNYVSHLALLWNRLRGGTGAI